MDAIRNGWFSELQADLWPGQCMSLQVNKVLHRERSAYQDILVLETTHHGKALILDGIIQCTERDEFAYQEMLALLPLCAHPNPVDVLIVGGGDGGVAREAVKHPHVQRVTQVEIDERVVDVARTHLPFMACGFDDPRVNLLIGDGFEHMAAHRAQYDVIITDSSDPIGPAASLFTAGYFERLASALKPGGVIASQGGCVWSAMNEVASTLENCRGHFFQVSFATVAVPSYPSGQIGLVLATNEPAIQLNEAQYHFGEGAGLKYYTPEMHRASFVLPGFIKKGLGI